MKNTIEIKNTWDGDTMTYKVYVNGKMESAHWTYEEAQAEASKYETVKEDTDMTDSKTITFEINGTIYSSNEKGNRFYKTIGTKKVRISEAEWDSAFDAFADSIETPEFGSSTEPNSQEEEKMAEIELSNLKANTDLWEQEADAERQAREDKVEADAKQAEEAVAKKTKKKSKKNVAFTFEDEDGIVTLTEKQVRFLTLLPNDDFYENGLDSSLWIDVLCDTLAGDFNPMALGAMVSTLREKYLISVGVQKVNGKKCKYFAFTELGKRVARELGLN